MNLFKSYKIAHKLFLLPVIALAVWILNLYIEIDYAEKFTVYVLFLSPFFVGLINCLIAVSGIIKTIKNNDKFNRDKGISILVLGIMTLAVDCLFFSVAYIMQ